MSLSKKQLKQVNKVVKGALDETLKDEPKKRGKYNTYTPEQRASIGKYANENGPTKAAAHFMKLLGHAINESMARKFKSVFGQN